MKKFLALFDLHFGYEKGYVNGKWVTRPTHNLPLVKAVNKFAIDFQPDIIILGGDQLNCGPISHWHKGRPRLDEGLRLKHEYDLLINNIFVPLSNIPLEKVIWLQGNHEQWVEDHINENPGLEGLVSFPDYYNRLSYSQPVWSKFIEWKDHGGIYKLGKLHFTHGDTILGGGRYANPAEQLLKQTRVNIRCGHLHSYYATTDFNPIRSNDYHTGIVVPCMCSTNTFYMKNKPSKVLNGFLYGYVYPDGNFQDYVVVTHNNKFIINGVEYK